MKVFWVFFKCLEAVNDIKDLFSYFFKSIKKALLISQKDLSSYLKINNIILQFQLQGSLNKFPDFFRNGTFIDSTHMKL